LQNCKQNFLDSLQSSFLHSFLSVSPLCPLSSTLCSQSLFQTYGLLRCVRHCKWVIPCILRIPLWCCLALTTTPSPLVVFVSFSLASRRQRHVLRRHWDVDILCVSLPLFALCLLSLQPDMTGIDNYLYNYGYTKAYIYSFIYMYISMYLPRSFT